MSTSSVYAKSDWGKVLGIGWLWLLRPDHVFLCINTGQHQDTHATLAAVRGHVSADDYAHMKRILLDGCPAQFDFEEPLSNKIEMIKCGNSKSFNNNTALVLTTMNNEDRYSHLIPLDEIMCRFSPYCCRTTQTMVIKAGKSDRLC